MQILTSDRAYQLPCIQGKERRTVSFFSPLSLLFSFFLFYFSFFLKRNLGKEIFGKEKKKPTQNNPPKKAISGRSQALGWFN